MSGRMGVVVGSPRSCSRASQRECVGGAARNGRGDQTMLDVNGATRLKRLRRSARARWMSGGPASPSGGLACSRASQREWVGGPRKGRGDQTMLHVKRRNASSGSGASLGRGAMGVLVGKPARWPVLGVEEAPQGLGPATGIGTTTRERLNGSAGLRDVGRGPPAKPAGSFGAGEGRVPWARSANGAEAKDRCT